MHFCKFVVYLLCNCAANRISAVKGMIFVSKYIGQQCTSCRTVFTENDDIVVCPECGSPYHRECYKNEGGCVNTVLHDGRGEWQPKELPKPPKQDIICPNCGNKNPPDARDCAVCRLPLENRENTWQSRPNGQGAEQQGAPNTSNIPNLPPFLSIRTITPGMEIDENTAGEYSSYVGMRFFYFIPKFQRFAKTHSKVSFNLSAFFFKYLWFFYRKMPIPGIIAGTISLISSFTTLIEYGAAMLGGYNTLVDDPRFRTLSALSALVSWGLSLFCGMFGDYLYYKKAKKDIAAVKSETSDSSYRNAELQRRGGTSLPLAIAAAVACGFIGSIVLSALMI